MNPEQLSDAMNELPQELLEETQAARSRRRLRWKPLAAAAACLLLAAGAWALAGRPAEPTPAGADHRQGLRRHGRLPAVGGGICRL